MKNETSPKTYDANLHETDDSARVERLENLAQDEIHYILDNYNVDEATLAERYAAFSAVEWSRGSPYLSIQDGITISHDDVADGATKAFTYDIIRDGNQTTPAIYYDDSLGQFDLSHEMFHIMSTSIEDYVDNHTEDIYLKRGIRLIAFDSDGQPINSHLSVSPQDQSLNEGITELLAKRFQRTQGHPEARTSFDYRKNHQVLTEYKQWTDLVDILSAPEHNQIIEAYFADDPYAPLDFMNDFDSRQSQISSRQLESIEKPSSGFFTPDSLPQGFIDERIVMACVEYSASFYHDTDSLDKEWQRIIPIAERIIRQNIQLFNSNHAKIKRYFNHISDTLQSVYNNQYKKTTH